MQNLRGTEGPTRVFLVTKNDVLQDCLRDLHHFRDFFVHIGALFSQGHRLMEIIRERRTKLNAKDPHLPIVGVRFQGGI